MDTCDLLNFTAAALDNQADKLGGTVKPFVDIETLHEALTMSPSKWAILIHWAGETPLIDGQARKLRMGVIVQAAKGLSIKPAIGITKPTASGREPIMELKDRVDVWVRSLRYQRSRIENGEKIIESHPRINCDGWVFGNSDWLVAKEYPSRQIRTYYTIDCSLPTRSQPITVEIPAETLPG